MLQTPGVETSKKSTPNIRTIEKDFGENDMTLKDYEAFKEFQTYRETYKKFREVEKEILSSKGYHSDSQEEARHRRKISRRKKKVQETTDESEEEP